MHDGFDLMDVFGPIEILSIARLPTPEGETRTLYSGPRAFEIMTTSSTPMKESYPGIKVAASISLQDAYKNLADFDVLVIPGGNSVEILDRGPDAEPMPLIRAFASLPAKNSDRIIMSVCTGALLLATAGVLKGQTATTNINDLDRLRKMADRTDTVVADDTRRFVVNQSGGEGAGRKGFRIMTSRGPGAGLDLSLWIVQEYVGEQSRKAVEDLMEYQGRLSEGLVL